MTWKESLAQIDQNANSDLVSWIGWTTDNEFQTMPDTHFKWIRNSSKPTIKLQFLKKKITERKEEVKTQLIGGKRK